MAAQVRASNSDGRMAVVRTGRLGFWAFDLDAPEVNGVNVRSEFLSRTKEKVRKPPPSLAAFTTEQRIVTKGVVRIQVEDGRGLPGQYEICQLKTIGWYLAEIVIPK